jgi:hypothetical protein
MGWDDPPFTQVFPLTRRTESGKTIVTISNTLLDQDCGLMGDGNLLDIDNSWEECGKNIFNEISAMVALSSHPSVTRSRSVKGDSRSIILVIEGHSLQHDVYVQRSVFRIVEEGIGEGRPCRLQGMERPRRNCSLESAACFISRRLNMVEAVAIMFKY